MAGWLRFPKAVSNATSGHFAETHEPRQPVDRSLLCNPDVFLDKVLHVIEDSIETVA
jgi:hypothetical protein